MKIAVCVKQVPVVSMLKFDNETRRLVRDGVPSEVNPFDVLAMSLAANLKQAHAAEIIVYTMGPPQAREALIQCLAMGADRAVHLTDRAFAGADTLATARALSLALAQDNPDLIICGRNSVDAETSQVGPEIAELLDLPQITNVRKLTLDAQTDPAAITAERATDAGHDLVRCQLPALITVTEEVAPETYPNRAARQAAQDKPIAELTAADLSPDASQFGLDGSPTYVSEIYSIEPQRDRILIRDTPIPDAVAQLMEYLETRGVFDQTQADPAASAPPRGGIRPKADIGAIWVVAETLGGKLRPVSLELLGGACQLADALQTRVEAILIGSLTAHHAPTLIAHGADAVHMTQRPELAQYETARYTHILAAAIRAHAPYAVLLPSTLNGRDLASRLAARLSLGLTGDCVGLEIDADGNLAQLKPAFGGNIIAPILSHTRPHMATVRPGILTPVAPDRAIRASIQPIPFDDLPPERVQLLETVANESVAASDLDSARVIVGVGKGIGGPENLPLVRELAAALDAPLGATRDITELGWLPRQSQIGLSGKSVAPALYIAVALRGVFNHAVGIQKAHTIVAINNNPRSPIFQTADIGILADYAQTLPHLTRALHARRA